MSDAAGYASTRDASQLAIFSKERGFSFCIDIFLSSPPHSPKLAQEQVFFSLITWLICIPSF
jgi:hypothetical protein